jgi:hypothetical protein
MIASTIVSAKKIISIYGLFCLAMVQVAKAQSIAPAVLASQGINGQVLLGDSLAAQPLKTTVLVYEVVNTCDLTEKSPGVFASVPKFFKLYKKIATDSAGRFSVRLQKPGKYSLIVKTKKGFQTGKLDDRSNVQVVLVEKGLWAEEKIVIAR